MEEKKEKRVLQIELDDDVKKLSITGKNGDEQVVMSQELNEEGIIEQIFSGKQVNTKEHATQILG